MCFWINFSGERSSSGLIEFESLTDSVEALAVMNHYPIKCPGTGTSFDDASSTLGREKTMDFLILLNN